MFWYTGLPKVIVDPPSQSVEVTQPVKFTTTVGGVGKENFIYQWRHNGVNIQGEREETLYLVNCTVDQSGMYECSVENCFGDEDVCIAELFIKSE